MFKRLVLVSAGDVADVDDRPFPAFIIKLVTTDTVKRGERKRNKL